MNSSIPGKIPAFHRANPGIDIRVIESDECLDLDRDDIDLAIRYGDGSWSNVSIIHLFDEEMFPICSAKMAKKNPDIANIGTFPNTRCFISAVPRTSGKTGTISSNSPGSSLRGNWEACGFRTIRISSRRRATATASPSGGGTLSNGTWSRASW